MDNLVHVKDANGNWVVLNFSDLVKMLNKNDFKIFGIDIYGVLELRKEYLMRNGPLPITPESVRETFDNSLVTGKE